ncbi:hypothetical protein RclHR1_10650006 [Rhizophagus clarus]|uniref:Uncharacterized protein n=1 Tax=Rhizophagus clarus TaxID=94130 RepID=A0A2Z6QUT5_9GLOM|nr:hypothetical protein RclHR1_10650006 [Rhizophagus clarus]
MTSELEVLKQHIIELEAKNTKLEAEKAEFLKQIMEENIRRDASLPVKEQLYNDNPSDDSTSNFNSVAEYQEKPLVDMETDNSFPEEVCYNKQELVATVPANSVKCFNGILLEEKDMNSFLLEAHKKIVSSEIKQHNKKKKLLRKSAKNQVLAVTSVNSKLTCDKKTVTIGNDQDLKLSLSISDNFSAPSLIEDSLLYDMKMITCTDSKDALSDEMPISSVTSIKLHGESILNNTIESSTERLAYWIDEVIRMGLKVILCLYYYFLEFKEKVKNITADGKTKDKTARSMIYKDMLQYLSNVTLDYVNDQVHVASKTVTIGNDDLSSVKLKQVPHPHQFLRLIQLMTDPIFATRYWINIPLDHDDEEDIESRYEARSYFIKCEWCNMTKTNKILTPEYLDWLAKLTGLPRVLTDKIRSNLYKKYKRETGFEPWQLSEGYLPINSKPENKVSNLSFSEQCEEKGPITFEVKPDQELIIKSILEHFPYLKFGNSFRGIDNYDFTTPQPWSSPCPICDGKHGN